MARILTLEEYDNTPGFTDDHARTVASYWYGPWAKGLTALAMDEPMTEELYDQLLDDIFNESSEDPKMPIGDKRDLHKLYRWVNRKLNDLHDGIK